MGTKRGRCLIVSGTETTAFKKKTREGLWIHKKESVLGGIALNRRVGGGGEKGGHARKKERNPLYFPFRETVRKKTNALETKIRRGKS